MKRKRRRLALSEPVEGASGKTGSWRTYQPLVNRELCNQCGLCVLYCPEAAISEEQEMDLRFCKGCGICANECPKKAIRMIREER
ncbi:MAG: 4Fe-4S binding protein [Methanomicrobiales archaeon]|nr:4Fe-4S binding protein [Methanomicrobiales archaeon]